VIPEQRQAINGRTVDRAWEPRAVEHYHRPRRALARLLDIAMACALGGGIALLAWAELTGRL
jgi:hypothetical protein